MQRSDECCKFSNTQNTGQQLYRNLHDTLSLSEINDIIDSKIVCGKNKSRDQ